ncbi:MAG: dihydroorotate dehydrogenase [Actinobacteria bacterium]|nr:dihydroorotate dehydrogenase [Actinomycetota bacterium]
MADIDLSVDLGKIVLKNPVTAASGIVGFGDEYTGLIDYEKIGGIFIKSLTLNPYHGNEPPRIAESSSGLLNTIGLQNPGVDDFIEKYSPKLSSLNTKIFVSVAGFDEKDFASAVEKLDGQDWISGYEINISCPNVCAGGEQFGTSPELSSHIVKSVRMVTSKFISAKLTPQAPDISKVAYECISSGVDAVSMINTIRAVKIDVDNIRPALSRLFCGLSGPAIKPIALCKVLEVYRDTGATIIGLGGISGGRDVMEFIMAGASAVSIGTAIFRDPGVLERSLLEMADFMTKHRIKSLNEIKGIALKWI